MIDTGCNRVVAGAEITNIQQFNFTGSAAGIHELPLAQIYMAPLLSV